MSEQPNESAEALQEMDALLASIEHIAPSEVSCVRRIVTSNLDNTKDDRGRAYLFVYASTCESFDPRTSLAKSAAQQACHRRLDTVRTLTAKALAAYNKAA